jgi:ankyrin repeat protein
MNIRADDPIAKNIRDAIHAGKIDELKTILAATPELATARIVDSKGIGRTLLHVVADWPGHFPNGVQMVAVLIAAGADPNAAITGAKHHAETAMHWAASSNDVAVLDALLDCGGNIEAPGAIFTGGSPMSDAVIFANWDAARRLLDRGAKTTLSQAAALGLLDRVKTFFPAASPSPEEITGSFWHACRGGQRDTVEFLLDHGAELNWIGWDNLTPLQAANKSGNADLVAWLQSKGAKTANEL